MIVNQVLVSAGEEHPVVLQLGGSDPAPSPAGLFTGR